MRNILLPALFLLAPAGAVSAAAQATPPAAQATPPGTPAEAPKAKAAPQELKPLSFFSKRFPFRWDQLMPLDAEVDGLKINSIYFNKRTMSLLKGAEFGTRAVVEVTNTASVTRVPGFAVAVFDSDNNLLGVASGGPKIGGVRSLETETFDLSFHQVLERIPRADHFYLAMELTD
jgi:hypothetical protein